jgi:hypothetical protein|tara:strand:+ start:447 stop:1307 length:861 start_codon:yes stop_codon:yes gene_type:complete
MDDLIGFFFGIVLLMFAIIVLAYVLAFLILAAMILVPCFFLGQQFYNQLAHKYRMTSISTLVLFLIGASSVVGAFGLVDAIKEPQGYSYILMVPLFLFMATATLGLWGLAKTFPFWWVAYKKEWVEARGHSEIKIVEQKISQISRKTKTLKTNHGTLLKRRKSLEEDVYGLCTRTGDQRLRTILKEKLEQEYGRLSIKDIEKRVNNLKSADEEKYENELKKCLLEIALIDARTGNARVCLSAKEKRIASLKLTKQQLEQKQEGLKRQIRTMRATLRDVKGQKIVLN